VAAWLPLVFVLGSMLVAAPSALGVGGLTLAVSKDPVRGLPVQFTANGTAPGPDVYGNTSYQLWTHSRPAAWGPCGTDVITDPNRSDRTQDVSGSYEQVSANGTFTLSWAWTSTEGELADTGAYLACAWLDDSTAGETVATAQQAFSLRRPHFALKLIGPARARLGKRGRFTARGSAEAPGHLVAEVLPPYVLTACKASHSYCHRLYVRTCAANPDAESNWLADHNAAPYPVIATKLKAARAFNFTRNLLAKQRGIFQFCGWIEEGAHGDGPVEALGRAKVIVK
jgi:hypothetical protein